MNLQPSNINVAHNHQSKDPTVLRTPSSWHCTDSPVVNPVGTFELHSFLAINLASGYCQVAMDPMARKKAAFTTHKGLFEWNVMPFGLCTTPAIFCRLIEQSSCWLIFVGQNDWYNL